MRAAMVSPQWLNHVPNADTHKEEESGLWSRYRPVLLGEFLHVDTVFCWVQQAKLNIQHSSSATLCDQNQC